MKSSFLPSGGDVFRALVECARWAHSWKFCTSYGALSQSSQFGAALEGQLPKLKYAIVGIDLHRSDPAFLHRLHHSEKLRVHGNHESGFGPNVFLFQRDEEVRVIVGGTPVDDQAFTSIFQAAVMTECDRHAAFALAAEEFFHRCLRASHLPTLLDIEQYSQSHAAVHPTLERARFVPWRRPLREPTDDEETLLSAHETMPSNELATDTETNDSRRDDSSGREPRPPMTETRTSELANEHSDDDSDSASDDRSRMRIEDRDASEVMIAFRSAAREGGIQTQEQLLRDVAQRFGFERLGKRIEQLLRGHLRAAIRRQIIRRREEDDCLCLDCRDVAAYDSDTLIRTVLAVMRPGCWCDRQVVIRDSANYLGFLYVTESVDVAMRNAIRTALRRGELESSGTMIRKT